MRDGLYHSPWNEANKEGVSHTNIIITTNLAMEKRPRRFSLREAFFEGSRSDGREDCLSMRRSYKEVLEWSQHTEWGLIKHAEFRSAEKNPERTA
jgi:predicted ATP-binding protein involved in virulence